MKYRVLALLLAGTAATASAADTLRLCTYNVLKYSASNEDGRIPQFARILDAIRPDILVCQEVDDGSIVPRFVNDVLTWGSYAASAFVDGRDTDNMLFFNQERLRLLGQRTIPTSLRNIGEFTLETVSTDGVPPDTIVVYSVHLKASDDASSRAQRGAEVAALQGGVTSHAYAIVAGDMNLYGPSEPAYVGLTAPTAGRRFVDPLGTTWVRNTTAYAGIYTQATRATPIAGCGGGVDGGLDDRFDFIMTSSEFSDRVLTSTYRAFGNDGQPRLNASIDSPPNTAVDSAMAAALRCASDHLPVYVDIVVGDRTASAADRQPARALRVEPNPAHDVVTITVDPSVETVVVRDATGRLVETFRPRTDGRIRWDIRTVAQGLYTITAGGATARVAVVH